MAEEFNSIDDFINHSGRGGGGDYLSWKKEGKVDVWLHTKRLPIAIWQHKFPQLVTFKDKKSGEPKVAYYSKPINCWEDESILKKQFFKDKATQERDYPPLRCPMCKLIDLIRMAVHRGELSWVDPVFEFSGASDSKDNIVLRAGGLYNAFASTKLTDAEREEMDKLRIYKKDAWNQNAMSKLAYVFCVVDNAHPDRGVQVSTETASLGDKVKTLIGDRMKGAANPDDGNPMVNPYAIQFTFDDGEKTLPENKYHARVIERYALTEKIRGLITGPLPDLSEVLAPFNKGTLRSIIEKYSLVDLPLDEVFAAPQLALNASFGGETKQEHQEPPKARPSIGGAVKPMATKPKADPPAAPCDHCGAPMGPRDTRCGACGTTYELDPKEGEDEIPY